MNPWKQLLDVQALDTNLAQLAHRSSQLPARAVLARVESELAELRTIQEQVDAERHVLAKQVTQIEDEVASIEDKIAHAEKQLYGAGSSDVKELQALQDEVASFQRRISRLEDDELEVMVQIEPVDARLEELAARRRALDDEAMAATTELAEAEAEIDGARSAAQEQREALVSVIDAAAVAEYDKVRAGLGGVAVARLETGGVCGACHMKLPAVEYDRIQHLPVDEAVRCEDCARFLVRD